MDVCTRPLYRIHRSTVIVLTLALATVVVVNIPGDRSVTHSNRYQHGWPYPYYERDGKPRSWWSFAGSNPELHIPALLLNSLMAGCTTALVACGCELWIRRFGRLYRFSIASMLGLTAIVAVVIGFVVRDVERCYQQQKVLIELAKLGSMSAYREERRLDWLRSLFGSQMDGSVRRVEVVATPLNQTSLPDLAALTDLKFLSLTGVNLGAIDAERLANAPSLEELQLTLTSVRGQSDEVLKAISEIPALSTLVFEGDDFKDEHLQCLSPQSRMRILAVSSRNLSARALQALPSIRTIEELSFVSAPMQGADLLLLSKLPRLKQVSFVGCNLSPSQERTLKKLWPDANVHFSVAPNFGRVVTSFRK